MRHGSGLASYEDGEYDAPYRDETASSQYTAADLQAILEHIQLVAIGNSVCEEHHGEPLHATARVYDTLVIIAAQIEERTGLFVGGRNGGSHDRYSVVETIENAV